MTKLCSHSSGRRLWVVASLHAILVVSSAVLHLPSAHAFATSSTTTLKGTSGYLSLSPLKLRPTTAATNNVFPKQQRLQQQRYHHSSSLLALKASSLPLHIVWEPVHALAAAGMAKFLSQWRTYCLIPIIAGLVGWVTNYLAVKMSTFLPAVVCLFYLGCSIIGMHEVRKAVQRKEP